jgi:hypothetical protein
MRTEKAILLRITHRDGERAGRPEIKNNDLLQRDFFFDVVFPQLDELVPFGVNRFGTEYPHPFDEVMHRGVFEYGGIFFPVETAYEVI